MICTLALLLSVLSPAGHAPAPLPRCALPPEIGPPEVGPIDDKALKALDAWLKHYRSGKMDFASQQDITKESFAARFAVVTLSFGSVAI